MYLKQPANSLKNIKFCMLSNRQQGKNEARKEIRENTNSLKIMDSIKL